jgi:hypothetical protein
MPESIAFEAQIKFAPNEPWQLVGVCFSRKQAAGVAATGFRTADPIGRFPSQVRVVLRDAPPPRRAA